MRFTNIRLRGAEVIDIPKQDVPLNTEFILKGVDGLGPPPIDVSIANWIGQGGVYQGRRPQNKEIIIRVGLNPDYVAGQSASDLREKLYGLIMPAQYAVLGDLTDGTTIEIVNGTTVVAQTMGYVKLFEINPNSKDPEVQITFATASAFLSSPNEIIHSSLSKDPIVITNQGTAPTGFYLDITHTSAKSSWGIFIDTPPYPQMTIVYPFVTGDRLMIDSRVGQRSVIIDPASGSAFNAIGYMTDYSTWLSLLGGTTTFDTSSPTFNWGSIRYTPQYWGI